MSAITASSGAFEASGSIMQSGARSIAARAPRQSEADESGAPVWAWAACWASTSIGAVLFFWSVMVAMLD